MGVSHFIIIRNTGFVCVPSRTWSPKIIDTSVGSEMLHILLQSGLGFLKAILTISAISCKQGHT